MKLGIEYNDKYIFIDENTSKTNINNEEALEYIINYAMELLEQEKQKNRIKNNDKVLKFGVHPMMKKGEKTCQN